MLPLNLRAFPSLDESVSMSLNSNALYNIGNIPPVNHTNRQNLTIQEAFFGVFVADRETFKETNASDNKFEEFSDDKTEK